MTKKIISTILSLMFIISSIAVPITAMADEYSNALKAKGFPDSYIPYLTALHAQYPNWDFQALATNLDFQTAVNGERSSHSKQLIQKTSSRSTNYYCNCANCLVNGSYVIREGSTWVSASESAVKHFMDPRNFLTDKTIFQFESTSYNSNHTTAGVEAILKGTFMSNSTMNYRTTDGVTQKTYTSNGASPKYSDTIMEAAKANQMSAYYLASRIRQEIGGASQSAIGVCGSQAPFQGIYNFFNIGANTGAMPGLEWASGYLCTTTATTMYSNYSNGTVSGTQTHLAANQYMTWRADSGNYYKVRLYSVSGGNYVEGATGFVPKSALRTTYFNYQRPWTNPYKAIIGGAAYIASSFSATQNTSYFEKFNVAPGTSSLYSHEYMANVEAPSSEAASTYTAYSSAGILADAKTFIIPVYLNMPASPCDVTSPGNNQVVDTSKVTGLTLSARTTSTLTYKWNSVSGATKYYVYIKNNTTGKVFDKTVSSTSTKISGLTPTNKYSVKVRAYVNGKYGTYSSYNTKHTLPGKVSGVSTSSRGTTSVTIKWNKMAGADSYNIYQYSPSKKTYKLVGNVSGSTTKYKISGLKSGTHYYFSVSAVTVDSKTKIGSKSSKPQTCTNPSKVTLSSVKSSSKKKITVKWKTTKSSGYQIQTSTSKSFKSPKSTYVSSSTKKSKTVSASKSKKKYYVRVRAYKKIGSKKIYSSWSTVKTVKTK